MISDVANNILANLERVSRERQARGRVAGLESRVRQLKAYQHQRFENTYRDLQQQARYAAATRFFLDELYGPHDFTDRDSQFARVVPALVRLFPSTVVETVRTLSELHALSEELDTQMGQALGNRDIDATSYQSAWQVTGRHPDRQIQIDLMLEIGESLGTYTKSLILRRTLRMMRTPARVAGLAALQSFLESGFDAFREMGNPNEFLTRIARTERNLVERLFSDEHVCAASVEATPKNP